VILAGAAQVFGERGYWDATTNHIAEAAGVSVGSVYEYFPNKDALLAALVEEHLREARALLEGLAADAATRSEWEALDVLTRRFVDALTALHERDPALHRVLFEQAPLEPRLREQMDRVERDLVAATAAILRRHPDVRVDDPEMAGAIVVHVLEALTHKLVIHPTPGMDREAYCAAVASLVSGYVSQAADG